MESYQQWVDTFGPQAVTKLVFSWAPSIVAAVLTTLVFALILFASRRILDRVFRGVKLDETVAAFVHAVSRFAIWTVGILTVLDQLGVDTVSILARGGVTRGGGGVSTGRHTPGGLRWPTSMMSPPGSWRC